MDILFVSITGMLVYQLTQLALIAEKGVQDFLKV